MTKTNHINLQIVSSSQDIPSLEEFTHWINNVLSEKKNDYEIGIRIVALTESQQLNKQYREKDKPTNVLSFPYDLPSIENEDLHILGDLVICAEVVIQEALDQHKSLHDHWAHLVTHGLLHLLGYDHETEQDAKEMETLEIQLLSQLNITNPYKAT